MSNIPTIAIIGAMEPEIELLKTELSECQTHQFGPFHFYSGQYQGKQIIVSLSGIGKVNAALATSLIIQIFNPDYVINTGSAGGIGKGLKIGDVVIGTHTAHHDVDVTAFGYQRGQVPQLPARFDSHTQLITAAEQAARTFESAQIVKGLIISGDQFINDNNKINELRQYFPDAQAVEMEAAAIAQSCAQLNKPFVVIRAISDSADDQANMSFDAFLNIAGRHSAQMVLKLIETI